MSADDTILRTGEHGQGRTVLAFSQDGEYTFTGGGDVVVSIWKTDEGKEGEPSFAMDGDYPITALAAADDCWLAGDSEGIVRRYTKNSNQVVGLLMTVTLPVRCLAFDPNGRKVAITHDDKWVRLLDIEDTTVTVDLKEGYTSGVRSATWHPSGSLLSTCTHDGKIVIWNMSSDKPKLEKIIEGIIPVVKDTDSPEFMHDVSVIWHTSGEYFFVATKGHEIVSISRSDWTKTATFSDSNAIGTVNALALSPNGVYLASASGSKVNIWSTQTRRLIASEKAHPESTICQLLFSPRKNLIAWTDTDGKFNRWARPIPSGMPDPIRSSISTKGSATISVKPHTGLDLFGDDTQEDSIAVDKEGADDDVDLDDDMADIDDGWIVDDLDGAHAPTADAEGSSKEKKVMRMVNITEAQEAFQPGSTPMENRKRYLAYNMIGVIDVTDQDTHNIVNVEFHDRSQRSGYYITDNYKYDLGYLGERGAVFACPPDGDHRAEVLFKPYGNTKANDWTYKLSKKGVKCLGIAAGALPYSSRNTPENELEGFGHVVVATSENDLTFLSGTGRERRIMALGGEFVTMVASAEWVFVVHRAGSTTFDGSQNLSYSIINFEDFSVRQRDVLPIPKKHTLKWVGITDQGAPAIFDSTGYVHILTKYRIPHHASWARVMDTNTLERRQGKDESYWPVGIAENNLMCLILKGRQEYPSFPRPLIQDLPMQMPFRQSTAQEESIEREMLRVELELDSLDEELTTNDIVSREKAMDKELIMLIQAACKAGNVPRAIELTKLLHHTGVLDAAMQVADFYHLPGLKEKMRIIKDKREDQEDRLIAAREKRRRWLKPDAPLRQIAESSSISLSSRYDPLADFRPPPVIERPGMSRVTQPKIERTVFSSHNTPSVHSTQERPGWDESNFPDSPPSETKRKRAEIEDSIPSSDISMPPPKQKSNPFARKTNETNNKNLFARKAESNKPVQKSESFFEKVDAAESEAAPRKRPNAAKGKDKAGKEGGSKQATLFGMMGKAADKGLKPKKKTEVDTKAVPYANGEETQADSQMTDLTMSESMVVESQELEETQPAEEWDDIAEPPVSDAITSQA
ncbi:Minichromosome loss protein 1 [Psilocybe cubensis]|uniref:Minichromosome loss protein 1 n=1 Tax=Psilocybe cubensis TaxID=181762 RepID=A0ACB8HAC4_PSICU|nr:Minichromosome loss protein 1 [Psilocybe cubensis]KAH9484953.1 Minichromosome loss protein 1 [Psilocybe cubensis]